MATTKDNCLHRFCDMSFLESLLSTYHVQLESLGQHNEELVCDYCVKFITYIGHLVLTTKLPKFPSTIMFIHFLLRYCFQLHWFSNFNYCRVHFIIYQKNEKNIITNFCLVKVNPNSREAIP